jgi:hypothetical protein
MPTCVHHAGNMSWVRHNTSSVLFTTHFLETRPTNLWATVSLDHRVHVQMIRMSLMPFCIDIQAPVAIIRDERDQPAA